MRVIEASKDPLFAKEIINGVAIITFDCAKNLAAVAVCCDMVLTYPLNSTALANLISDHQVMKIVNKPIPYLDRKFGCISNCHHISEFITSEQNIQLKRDALALVDPIKVALKMWCVYGDRPKDVTVITEMESLLVYLSIFNQHLALHGSLSPERLISLTVNSVERPHQMIPEIALAKHIQEGLLKLDSGTQTVSL